MMTNPAVPEVTMLTAPDGIQLACRYLPGDGNLLVALHGFTGDGSTMVPLVEEVRNGRPAIVVDLVGHGKSQAPEHLEHYSMASVVDQILSVIGLHDPMTVHLIGYSLGGRVALSMAARAPWYFASLTLLSATAGLADPAERSARHDADIASASHLLDIGLDAFVDEWLSLDLFESYVTGLTSDALQETKAQRRETDPVGLANSLRGTGTGAMPPLWHLLASIRSPVLAIAGSLDEKFSGLAVRIAESTKVGACEIIDGAGHVVHIENLSQVASIVRPHLTKCESDEDHPS